MAVARRYTPKMVENTKTVGFLLYLFLIPPLISVILALFALNIKAFFLNFLAFLLFFGALYYSKKGFEEEFRYHMSNFTKAPKPYKLTGAIFLSLATFYSSYVLSNLSFFQSFFLSLIAFLGYYLWYGFDPREDKIPDTGDYGSEVALETLKMAKERLKEIEKISHDIKNPDLRHRVGQTIKKAKEIVQELDKNPKYIRNLRKFLVVYLDSIYDVTKSYINTQEEVSQELKKSLYNLMDKAEEKFERELQKVKSRGVDELDTKIKVLDRQIKER